MNYRVASRQQVQCADVKTPEQFAAFTTRYTEQVRIEQAQRVNPNVETVHVNVTGMGGLPYSVSSIDGEPFMVNTATFNNCPDSGRKFATLYFWMLEREAPDFEGEVKGFSEG